MPPLEPLALVAVGPAVDAGVAEVDDPLAPLRPTLTIEASKPRPKCVPNAQWRDGLNRTLKELGTLALPNDAFAAKYDGLEPPLSRLIRDAQDQAACLQAEKQMAELKHFIVGTP